MPRLIVLLTAATVATSAPASDYVAIELHAPVSVSADAAWARVGRFCDIARWGKLKCALRAGSGGAGTVRVLNDGFAEEPMVGRASRSYTYGQTVGPNAALDYHGTLAVEPTGRRTARVDYTLVYDQARVPADQREKMRAQLAQRFQTFVDAIKAAAEKR